MNRAHDVGALNMMRLEGRRLSIMEFLMVYAIPFGVLFSSITFFHIKAFEFNVALFCVLLFIIYYVVRISRFNVGILCVVVSALSYSVLVGIASRSALEFFESLALISVFLVSILILYSFPVAKYRSIVTRGGIIFVNIMTAHALFVICQAVFLNIFDSYALQNPFGPFSPRGPGGEVYLPHVLAAIKRPNGLFSEPSVAAWMMWTALSLALILRSATGRPLWVQSIVMVGGIVATVSAAGSIAALVLLAGFVFLPGRSVVGGKAFRTGVIVVLLLALAASVSLGVAGRAADLTVPGTSAYYRVTAPLILMTETLVDNPLGYPLGHREYIADKTYMVNWERGHQDRIDNSFLLLAFHYGYVGVAFFLWVCFSIARRYLAGGKESLVYIALFLAFATTGSGYSPIFTVLLIPSLLVARSMSGGSTKRFLACPRRTH